MLVAGGSKNVRQLREAIAAAAGEAESSLFEHDPAVCGHTKRELIVAMSELLEEHFVDENDAPEKVKLVAKQGSNTIHLTEACDLTLAHAFGASLQFAAQNPGRAGPALHIGAEHWLCDLGDEVSTLLRQADADADESAPLVEPDDIAHQMAEKIIGYMKTSLNFAFNHRAPNGGTG